MSESGVFATVLLAVDVVVLLFPKAGGIPKAITSVLFIVFYF
jgi:hypothetical protein